MFKIALSAGHGLHTAGKRCPAYLDPGETREWWLNDRICDKIEEKLKSFTGYELLRLDDTTGETDVALKTRTTAANDWGADFYLAIHHNAGVGGKSGGGVVAIVYKSVDSKTTAWQLALYNAVIAATGLRGNRSQPLSRQDLHEVRESRMPAVLLECGFMDSSTDCPIILTEAFADSVAEACVSVLAERGGLRIKPKEPVPAPAPVTPAPAPAKDLDTLAREVIRGDWGNGAERVTRLQNAGFDPVAVQARVNEIKGVAPAVSANYFAKYCGTSGSIVTALKAVGEDSSYLYRRKIAAANGIENYSGTADQNVALLLRLKQGKLIKP